MMILGYLHLHATMMYTYYKATKYIFKNSREIIYAIDHGIRTGTKFEKEAKAIQFNRSQYQDGRFEEL